MLSVTAAAAVTHVGWNGYNGSQTVYMTSGILSGSPYLIQTTYNSSVQDTMIAGHPLHNAVNLSAGQAKNTTSQDDEFIEYFVGSVGGSSPYLLVDIPIATGGGTDFNRQPLNPGWLDTHVDYQIVSLSMRNSPSTLTREDYTISQNGGLNVTGPNYVTQALTPTQSAKNFVYDALCTFVPYVGYACGGYSMYNDIIRTGVGDNNPSATGNGDLYESFQVTNVRWGSKTLFATHQYVVIRIPASEFTTNLPMMILTAKNFVGEWDQNGFLYREVQGATATFTISAIPAVTLTGTVSLGGSPLKNQAITLEETYNGAVIDYQLTTNSTTGTYRFFARPGSTYTLSTTYGPRTWQTSNAMPSDTTSSTMDLSIPRLSVSGLASPSNTQPGVSVQFAATLSGAYKFPVIFSWDFGDGTGESGPSDSNPQHIYGGYGTFYAGVTVTDSSSPSQRAITPLITINVANSCTGSSACISPSSQNVYWNFACVVPTASFSGFAPPGSPGPFTYSWNFGDLTTGTGQTVSHTYSTGDATYTVILTVTDSQGRASTATATVTERYVRAC
jgi:hypothetical protein